MADPRDLNPGDRVLIKGTDSFKGEKATFVENVDFPWRDCARLTLDGSEPEAPYRVLVSYDDIEKI